VCRYPAADLNNEGFIKLIITDHTGNAHVAHVAKHE